MKRRYRQLKSELRIVDSKEFKNITRIRAVAVLSIVNLLGFVAGNQHAAVRNATLLCLQQTSSVLQSEMPLHCAGNRQQVTEDSFAESLTSAIS